MRLRVSVVLQNSTILFISIPSGAIKRSENVLINSALNSFQFLLVRLRVDEIPGHVKMNNIFQFLLVRLRACFINPYDLYASLFQFLLVRLRASMHDVNDLLMLISIPSGAIKSIVNYICQV